MLDTGFDGALVVPPNWIPATEFRLDFLSWTLADGSAVTAAAYFGTAQIGTLPRFAVLVTALGAEPLVGRGVSDRFSITLDHGQRVIIEPSGHLARPRYGRRVVEMEDLHELLARFERAGRLLRVTAPVDPRFELPGVCTRLHRDPALRQHVALFENVQGHTMPVVGNLCDTREKVAFALGCEPAELLARGVRAVEQPIPPVVVESGPCQDVTLDPPDLRQLPLARTRNWTVDLTSTPACTSPATRPPACATSACSATCTRSRRCWASTWRPPTCFSTICNGGAGRAAARGHCRRHASRADGSFPDADRLRRG